MKTFFLIQLTGLLATISCVWTTPLFAQGVVVDTSSTYAGTVAQYEPVNQILVVNREASKAPMTYSVTQATTFVDESGVPVAAERVVSGVPITVHYMRQGDRMTATRVVVRRGAIAPVAVERVERAVPAPTVVERTTTVTTTSNTGAGRITEYVPGSPNIVLRNENAAPVTYSVSRATTFVDENGTPVARERIAPGVPVSVQYVQEGDRMVASRVMVVREPQRKLRHDEKEALQDAREATDDLREAQRKAERIIKDKND